MNNMCVKQTENKFIQIERILKNGFTGVMNCEKIVVVYVRHYALV